MTEWCSCNKLREAEKKAAKWDAIAMCVECKHAVMREAPPLGIARWCDYNNHLAPKYGFCAWGERRDA